MSFSWIGLLLFSLPMIPNVLFFTVLKPQEKMIDADAGLVFNIVENGGRIGYLILLVTFSKEPTWILFPTIGMALFLGFVSCPLGILFS